ncbi:MAG: hypothetical protein AAFZ18_34980 [Myxococcota bacterium]
MSHTDDFAREVGRLMQEDHEVELDPRLERLAAGELDPAARAALEREAESNPDLADALELFRPSTEAELATRLATATEARDAAPVVHLPFRAKVGAVAAAAAAAVVWVLPPTPPSSLPPMTLEVTLGDRDQRGDAKATATIVDPGAEVQLVLRPDRAVATPVEAALYVQDETGRRRAPVDIRIAESGAVRVRHPVGQLGVGRLTVALAVARRDHLPTPTALFEGMKEGTAEGANWRASGISIEVRSSRAPPKPDP